MASGGITGEPVQTARFGSYMRSTGGGKRSNTVTQRDTSGGGSSTQRKSIPNIKQGNAERQLNNLVIKSRNDEKYRNEQGAGLNYGTAYDLAPKAAKDFVNRQLEKTGGRLNEAAKARLNSYLTDRTQYQLDLDKFRKASPANEAAYVKRFPKTAAFERILRQGAEGIIGTPGRVIKNLADTYLDGVKNMVEKISGVDAKNVEIAKDKDADISTIVNNLQRNIKEEREDGKARGMSEADLTAMYGDPIDVETGDDIFGADLIGMDLLEEDSPLRKDDVAPDAVPLSNRGDRGADVAPGAVPSTDVAARERDVAPGFDLTAADNLIDLSGTSGRLDDPKEIDTTQEFEDTYGVNTPGFQEALRLERAEKAGKEALGEDAGYDFLPNVPGNQGYLDFVLQEGTEDGKIRPKLKRTVANKIQGVPATGFDELSLYRFMGPDDEQFYPIVTSGSQTGFGRYDTFQDPETLGPGTVPSFTEAPFEYFPLFEGLTDFDFSPELRREPETFNTRADGGEIFGNQNMSTFDKLKAIADGIADNK